MDLGGGIGDIALAFLAGGASFLSPCVLPLIPGYLSFISGVAPSELGDRDRPISQILVPSLLFVLGFSIVFIGLGVSASLLGEFFSEHESILQRILGGFVASMGFFMLGVVKIPWLYGEARIEMSKAKSFGRGASLVMGMAFALGWTPCVGPILASILALSMSSGDSTRGAILLASYSLGLGVPFVVTGLLFDKLRTTIGWLSRHSIVINRVAGVFLMTIGALIFFDKLSLVAGWFLRYLPSIELL